MRVSPGMPSFRALRRRRPRSARAFAVVLLVGLAAVAGILWARPAATPVAISGRPAIVDGDTLAFPETRVRIVGIDAPELDQTCRDASGLNWQCGEKARGALRAFIGNAPVRCNGDRRDRYGRVLAACSGASGDLGAAMVAAGLAIASGRYEAEEAQARANRIGLWAGAFETPRAWRDRQAGFDLWAWITGWFGD